MRSRSIERCARLVGPPGGVLLLTAGVLEELGLLPSLWTPHPNRRRRSDETSSSTRWHDGQRHGRPGPARPPPLDSPARPGGLRSLRDSGGRRVRGCDRHRDPGTADVHSGLRSQEASLRARGRAGRHARYLAHHRSADHARGHRPPGFGLHACGRSGAPLGRRRRDSRSHRHHRADHGSDNPRSAEPADASGNVVRVRRRHPPVHRHLALLPSWVDLGGALGRAGFRARWGGSRRSPHSQSTRLAQACPFARLSARSPSIFRADGFHGAGLRWISKRRSALRRPLERGRRRGPLRGSLPHRPASQHRQRRHASFVQPALEAACRLPPGLPS